MKVLIPALLGLILTGCGTTQVPVADPSDVTYQVQFSGSPGIPAPFKELQAIWTAADGSSVDLTAGTVAMWTFPGGIICRTVLSTQVNASNTGTYGNWMISAGGTTRIGPLSADPAPCQRLVGTLNYSITMDATASTLTLTSSSGLSDSFN